MQIPIRAEEGGARVDSLLATRLPQLSRAAVQRLLENGLVSLEGRPIRKNYRVQAGDLFLVELPPERDSHLEAQAIPLQVVYEDEDLIVVDKPRGMVVHPAPGHPDGTLVNALLAHCGASLSGIGGEKRPGIVHRIDKDTSGLIIAAKNDRSHQALAAQLKDHSLYRVYAAIALGRFREAQGTVNAPIGRDPKNRKRMAVTEKNSRPAVTHYQVLEDFGTYSYVRCRLETGRTHQIRVHMAHLGHPLLGDSLYGGRDRRFGLEGQCLHAGRLGFVHPSSGEVMELSAPLPAYFQAILDKLRHQVC